MQLEQIALREDLGIQLMEDAEQSETSVDQLLNQAVEEFLLNKQRAKIDGEVAAFVRLHPELWRTKPGQWVAIHNSHLVDADSNRVALYRRVRERYGRVPVLIREVTAEAEQDIWLRTPSTGKMAQ